MANTQYQHGGEYKGYQPDSYGYQKKEYNHQPSYGMGHAEHSYSQPASYEHKGYGSHGYQAKPYSNEKKEYNHQYYQPAAYDKGQSYHGPSSYEHHGSHGYDQPKSYGHHYPKY
jgi:hypothetical protein